MEDEPDINDKTLEEPEINDKTLEVNFLDSSQINPKEYASADIELPDMPLFNKDVSEFEGVDMLQEQDMRPEIRALRLKIKQGRAEISVLKKTHPY